MLALCFLRIISTCFVASESQRHAHKCTRPSLYDNVCCLLYATVDSSTADTLQLHYNVYQRTAPACMHASQRACTL
jgi:hypothetical protein